MKAQKKYTKKGMDRVWRLLSKAERAESKATDKRLYYQDLFDRYTDKLYKE